jgi:hypothetical protein
MEQQILRRSCDYCGSKEDFNLAVESKEKALELQAKMRNWIAISDLVYGEKPAPKIFCKKTCAVNFLKLSNVVPMAEQAAVEVK